MSLINLRKISNCSLEEGVKTASFVPNTWYIIFSSNWTCNKYFTRCLKSFDYHNHYSTLAAIICVRISSKIRTLVIFFLFFARSLSFLHFFNIKDYYHYTSLRMENIRNYAHRCSVIRKNAIIQLYPDFFFSSRLNEQQKFVSHNKGTTGLGHFRYVNVIHIIAKQDFPLSFVINVITFCPSELQ